jgi:hypothetical protein
MNIKRVTDLEHNFNGHAKFKLITYLVEKKGFMGLSTTNIKKRILYTFDPEKDKKGEAKMYFLNNNREVEKQLTNTEYNYVADLVVQFQTVLEANNPKEEVIKD